MSDAMEAAATMLYGPIDPVKGKPEELDPHWMKVFACLP